MTGRRTGAASARYCAAESSKAVSIVVLATSSGPAGAHHRAGQRPDPVGPVLITGAARPPPPPRWNGAKKRLWSLWIAWSSRAMTPIMRKSPRKLSRDTPRHF